MLVVKTKEDTQKASINKSLFPFLFTSTGSKIGEIGTTSLSDALKSNTTLTKLNIGCEHQKITLKYRSTNYSSFFVTPTDNNIGDAGTTSLSEALKSNTTLISFILTGEDKGKKHAKDIHQQFTLSFLFTSTENGIKETGATSLSKALKSNTTLTELNLSGEGKRKDTKDIHQQFTLPFSLYQQATRLETKEQRRWVKH